MHITHINFALNGRSFDQDLAPCTVITGGNFTGKTAIFRACQLALMGFVPECGGRPSDAFRLLGDGRYIESTLSFNSAAAHKGISVTGKMVGKSIDWTCEDPGGLTEALRALPLLTPSGYFNMTETERNAYVFERCRMPEGYDAAGIVARLQRISFGEQHSKAIEEAKAQQIAKLNRYFPPGGPVQVGLEQSIDHLREEYTGANRSAKDSEGALRVFSELKVREPECSAETVADIEAQETKLRTELSGIQQRAGAARQRRQEAVALQSRRDSLAERIERDRAALAAPETAAVKPPTYAEEDAARAAWEAVVVPVVARRAVELQQAVNAAMHAERIAVTEQARLIQERDALQQEFDELEALECCPNCKAKAKGWKKAIEATLNEKRAALDLTRTLPLAEKKVRDTAAAHQAAIDAMDAHRASIEAERVALAEKERLRCIMVSISKDIAAAATVAATRATARAAAEKRLAETEAELAGLPVPEPVSAAPRPLSPEETADSNRDHRINEELYGLQAKRDAATRLRGDLRRAAEAAELHEGHAARRDVIKRLGEELKAIQAEMVAAAFGGLLATANQIAAPILLSALAFHEGTIGRWDGTAFVSHKTMSGVERLLTYIAIAAALSQGAPLKLAMIDEMGNATPRVREQIMATLRNTVERGILDQVLVIIPSEEPVSYDGWTTVEVRP